MKTIMCLAWLILASAVIAQEDVSYLINRIIQSGYSFAYNPTNDTPEELIKAAALNAELTLKRMILDSNEEELKTCYALQILNRDILRIESMIQSKDRVSSMDLPVTLKLAISHREVLVNYLREIQQRIAEKSAAGDSPQGVVSPKPQQ